MRKSIGRKKLASKGQMGHATVTRPLLHSTPLNCWNLKIILDKKDTCLRWFWNGSKWENSFWPQRPTMAHFQKMISPKNLTLAFKNIIRKISKTKRSAQDFKVAFERLFLVLFRVGGILPSLYIFLVWCLYLALSAKWFLDLDYGTGIPSALLQCLKMQGLHFLPASLGSESK